METGMDFEVNKSADSVFFTLKEKRLDATVSPALKAEFLLLCKPKVKNLVVDLSTVDFCDSSGLSALLIAQRQMNDHGGKVTLAGCKKSVMSLLKISQLERVFEVKDSISSMGGASRDNHSSKRRKS
jgi:anti-anti-sigma factor